MKKTDDRGFTEKTLIYDLYRLMFEAHNAFMEASIPYIANGGTLLGAVRHKGMIPWDDDLDVQVDVSYEKQLTSKSFKQILAEHGIVIRKSPNGWYKLLFKPEHRTSVHIADMDIFISKFKTIDGVPHIVLTGNAGKYWPKSIFKVSDTFPLTKYKFGKIQIIGPKNANPYLNLSYGKSWKTVGYITMDDEHMDLDEPIKVKVTKFVAAKDYYDPRVEGSIGSGGDGVQILPRKGNVVYDEKTFTA